MRSAPSKGTRLPLELSGLVEIGSREYAGQVSETLVWCGRWGFREAQDQPKRLDELIAAFAAESVGQRQSKH